MAELLLDFLSRETEKKPAIVGRGILPVKGKAILGGPPKSNKSYVVLNAALDVAKGRNLFGASYKNDAPVFPVNKQHKVLLLEQEIGEDGLRGRMRSMIPTEEAICPFYIKSKDISLRLDTSEGIDAITREVEEVMPDLLIFDPLSKFHGIDENSAQDVGRIMRAGDMLIQRYGLSILYIHHTGLAIYDKENTRRGGATLRGSSALFADVDTFIGISRVGAAHVAEPVLALNFELRQGEPLRPQYIKRLKDGHIQYIGEDLAI